jgi:hypothetical protein
MAWCEHNGIDYIFGLAGSKPLSAKVEATADAGLSEILCVVGRLNITPPWL